jgi:hypothetical protein
MTLDTPVGIVSAGDWRGSKYPSRLCLSMPCPFRRRARYSNANYGSSSSNASLARQCQRQNTPISGIVFDAMQCQANKFAHSRRFGLEFRESKEVLQQQGDFIGSLFGHGNADNAVTLMRFDLFPKISNIDRDEGRLGNLPKQDGNSLVFDNRVGAQPRHGYDATRIPGRNRSKDVLIVQVFVNDNHGLGGKLQNLNRLNEGLIGQLDSFHHSFGREATMGIVLNNLFDGFASRDA